MLSAPKTSDRTDPPPSDAGPRDVRKAETRKPEVKQDPEAKFIHDLAESGAASELSTVKAASDAVEGENKADDDQDPREDQDGA